MQRYRSDKTTYKDHSYGVTVKEHDYEDTETEEEEDEDEITHNRHRTTHNMMPHYQLNHSKNHGYGPQNGPRKNQHERFPMQNSENWYEEKKHTQAWSKQNDYNAYGGKHYYNGNNGGMPRAPRGQYGHHRNQKNYQNS